MAGSASYGYFNVDRQAQATKVNKLETFTVTITVFIRVIFAIVYFSHPNFSSVFRGLFARISQPSILHLGMVTHSYCRSWQSVTSFVLQECGISVVLVRTLGI
jgi:hypothetical protein